MSERVAPADLGLKWEPNAPAAVMAADDSGLTALALGAHPDDPDQQCVVLTWAGTRTAWMTDPNDEAMSGHRLYSRDLREIAWAGRVLDSEMIDVLERQNRVHRSTTRSDSGISCTT